MQTAGMTRCRRSHCISAGTCRRNAGSAAALRAVFSRSGFTDGYYTGKRQQMFGTRQKDDDAPGAERPAPAGTAIPETHTAGSAGHACHCVQTGQPAVLKLRDGDGISVSVSGDVVQPARTKQPDPPQLELTAGKAGRHALYPVRFAGRLRRNRHAPRFGVERSAAGGHCSNERRQNRCEYAKVYHAAHHAARTSSSRTTHHTIPHHPEAVGQPVSHTAEAA